MKTLEINSFFRLFSLLLIFGVHYGHFMDCNDGCHTSKSDMINVHLVPHSIDRIGYAKTFSQYYNGNQNKLQSANVKSKLHLVIKELLQNPNRRFSYGQLAYFLKWFRKQEMKMQNDVKHLIRNGQLELVGGGFVMNDEATVHYQSLIDQFSLSLKTLTDELSYCARPQVGWQIDTYGHSREMASLLAQMGYHAHFINYITKSDKKRLLGKQNAEMIWHTSDILNDTTNLFTILLKTSKFPDGFCFDMNCHDEPIIDDDGTNNNVEQKVNDFILYVKQLAKNYRTNEVFVPMGEHFSYENSYVVYNNLDKLIKYVNNIQTNGTNINMFYSTPSCYVKALKRTVPKPSWPIKTNDFFPYNSWTGYYTSRPSLKYLERYGNRYLQVVKQLAVMAKLETENEVRKLNKLRRQMALIQNHNGITGAAKQHVINDYVKELSAAIYNADDLSQMALKILTRTGDSEYLSCHQLNISVCEFSVNNANNLEVLLYNPLSSTVIQPVRIPFPNGSYYVENADGHLIRSHLRPVPKELMNLRHIRNNATEYELVFLARVDKLAQYRIKPRSTYDYVQGQQMQNEFTVSNKLVKLYFDSNGFLSSVEMNGLKENIRQSFYYYKSAKEDKEPPYTKSSGIYAFMPENSEAVEITQKVMVEVYNGAVVTEVHQHFNEWVSQVIRIYDNINRVEFEWLIGPIPVEDGEGKEIITRFTTDIISNGTFYTDANGREMLLRQRYERDESFLPRNYYPVTTRMVIQDDNKRLALLNDRPQGGSSVEDGSLELMLHRRILMDDGSGLNEYLNEMEYNDGLIVSGKTYLILNQKDAINDEIMLQQEIHLPLWPFFSEYKKSKNLKHIPKFSYIPIGINILTLEPYSPNQYLLRLENILQNKETDVKSFDLMPLLFYLKANHVREMSLDGNVPKIDFKDFPFQEDNYVNSTSLPKRTYLDLNVTMTEQSLFIDMEPMEILTLLLTCNK